MYIKKIRCLLKGRRGRKWKFIPYLVMPIILYLILRNYKGMEENLEAELSAVTAQVAAALRTTEATQCEEATPPPPPPAEAPVRRRVTGAAAQRPWFLAGGERRPDPAARDAATGRYVANLWPHELPRSDRILEQLMFVPPAPLASHPSGRAAVEPSRSNARLKVILLYDFIDWDSVREERAEFRDCPVNNCYITQDTLTLESAQLVAFKETTPPPGGRRPAHQVWMFYALENPHYSLIVDPDIIVNWTATYRHDSDIVTPYGRWVYYDEKVKQNPKMNVNYAANKTKLVAWIASNCFAVNGRQEYINELEKHIAVDIYGGCGKKCPKDCLQMLQNEYKFYLAFENSNCNDYITEKLFINGFMHGVLPVVMGARPQDYARAAPLRSYLHVDTFASPRHLADFLKRLDEDDDLYNLYFRWKGTGEFINTFFWCRVCAMLHGDPPPKSYKDVNAWWRMKGICKDSVSASARRAERPLYFK